MLHSRLPRPSLRTAFILALCGLFIFTSVPLGLLRVDAVAYTVSHPTSLEGWLHYSTRGNSPNPADTSCTGCVPAGAVGAATNAYVTGAATPPVGGGSVRHATGDGTGGGGATGRGGRLWSTIDDLNGVLLSDIQTISYSTYTDPASPDSVLKTAINLYVDLDGDGSALNFASNAFPGAVPVGRDAVLVFEPVYTAGNVTASVQGSWQTWVITQTNGLWWDTRNNVATNSPCGGNCRTLGQIATAFPNARVYGSTAAQQAAPISGNTVVGSVFNGFLFGSGSSGGAPWTNYDGNIDNVRFQVGGSTPFDVTYDFETAPYNLFFVQQPTDTVAGTSITPAITVRIADSANNTVTGATNTITLTIGSNPGGGTLLGSVSVAAVGGVATFPSAAINNAGVGYTLNATAPGMTSAVSTAFNITPPPTLSINSPAAVIEGDTGTVPVTFTVALSTASASVVTVDYATANGTATAPNDYTSTTGTLTFNPGDPLTQSITVNINGDEIDEADETFTVTLSNATVGITTAAGTATIQDDDSAGITLLRPGGTLVIAEGGATGSIGVNLNTQPTADVTLTFTPDAQCELNTGAGFGGAGIVRSLTFTAANWSTLTPVVVRAIDDLLFEGPHTCAITVGTPTSADANYNGAAPAITLDGSAFTAPGLIAASVTDNDIASATPTFTPTSTGTVTPTLTPTSTGTATATAVATSTAAPPPPAATEVPVIGTFTLVDGRRVINDGRTITIVNPDGTTQTISGGRVTLANNQITVFDNTGRPVIDLVTVAAQSLGVTGIVQPGGTSQFVTLTGTGIAGRGTTTVANIVVTNTSGTTLNNAVLTINAGGLGLSFGPGAFNPLEQLLAALTGASAADAQSAELRWAIGTLAPGQSVTRAVTVSIPANFTGNSFTLTTTLTADGLAPETDTVFYSVASGLPATGETVGLPPLLLIAALGGIMLLAAVTLARRRPQA